MTLRYQVPQDLDKEDKIFIFISLRQLIILMIGFFISYGLYTSVGKLYYLNTAESIFLWFPLGIAAMFAFLEIADMSLTKFILVMVEQLFFRPPRRYFEKNAAEPFISMTYPFRMNTDKIAPTTNKVVDRNALLKAANELSNLSLKK